MNNIKEVGKYKCPHCGKTIQLVNIYLPRQRLSSSMVVYDLEADREKGQLCADIGDYDFNGDLMSEYGCPYCDRTILINKKDIF